MAVVYISVLLFLCLLNGFSHSRNVDLNAIVFPNDIDDDDISTKESGQEVPGYKAYTIDYVSDDLGNNYGMRIFKKCPIQYVKYGDMCFPRV